MRTFLILILFYTPFHVFSQYKSPVFFDELNFSFNESDVKRNTVNKNGFGISLTAFLSPEKQNNLFISVEYNYLQILKPYLRKLDHIYFIEYFDLSYKVHNLSMPIGYRFNIGNLFKYFIHPGIFFDWNFIGSKEGYRLNQYNLYYFKTYNQKTGYNFGFLIGSGFEIPFYKHALIAKADYKLGTPIINFFDQEFQVRYYRFSLGFRYKVSKKIYQGL